MAGFGCSLRVPATSAASVFRSLHWHSPPIPLIGGRYLFLNYLMFTLGQAPAAKLLTPGGFLVMYGRLLLRGSFVLDVPFLAMLMVCSAALPIADRLYSQLPPWAHK